MSRHNSLSGSTSLLIDKLDYPKALFQFGSPQRVLRKIFDHLKELHQFGSPQRALRKILCEDKEIDQMFKEFMNSITGYQHLTTQGMDDIYNESLLHHKEILKMIMLSISQSIKIKNIS